jgi:hypothetical protein
MSAPVTSGLVSIDNGAESSPVSSAYYGYWYQRVGQIMVTVCLAVLAEDPATDGHITRAGYARQYLATCHDQGRQIAITMMVMADGSITVSSTSQQIADRLASIFSPIAGA